MAQPLGDYINCGKPASLHCSACSEGVDIRGSPYQTCYCNKDCQGADWKKHKQACRQTNDRKQLYRGASLVQDVFYAFREAAFDVKVKDITKESGRLSVHIDLTKASLAQGPLFDFPSHLLTNEDDKKALLSWCSSEEAMALMHVLLDKFLHGISTAVPPMETSFPLSETYKIIHKASEESNTDPTAKGWALILMLGKDEAVVVDLAGAQYGQSKAVMALADWPYVKIVTQLKVCEVGHCAAKKQAIREDTRGPVTLSSQKGQCLARVHAIVTNFVNEMLEKHEENWMMVTDTLKLRQDKFDLERSRIMLLVKNGVQTVVEHLQSIAEPIDGGGAG